MSLSRSTTPTKELQEELQNEIENTTTPIDSNSTDSDSEESANQPDAQTTTAEEETPAPASTPLSASPQTQRIIEQLTTENNPLQDSASDNEELAYNSSTETQTLTVTEESNIFLKLHHYLSSHYTDKPDATLQRKIHDFAQVLAIGDSHHSSEDYSKYIKETTQHYNTGLLGTFTAYHGEFKNLMKTLHNTNPDEMLNQRSAYQKTLNRQIELNIDFAVHLNKKITAVKTKAHPSIRQASH